MSEREDRDYIARQIDILASALSNKESELSRCEDESNKYQLKEAIEQLKNDITHTAITIGIKILTEEI